MVSDELKTIAKHLRDLADECENSFALKAKLMKDLSGLCKKGWLRLMEGFHRAEIRQRIAVLREDPAIKGFLDFAHSCNPQGLPDIAALLGKEFYELDRALQQSHPATAEAGVGSGLGHVHPLPPPPDNRRPRSPLVPPTRSLPTPRVAPDEEHYEWNIPWVQLLRENMSMWQEQLYVRCPGCWKFFVSPSAFKQHLRHKKDTFRHVPTHVFQNWNCDELWDPAWHDIQESKRAEARGYADEVPRTLDGEVEDKGWMQDIPPPPQPIRSKDELQQMQEQGWLDPVAPFVVEMMAEEAHRAANVEDSARQNWFAYVKSIDVILQEELKEAAISRKAFINFPQVKECTIMMRLNPSWSSEEVLSHIAAELGMTFEHLGSRWLLAFDGSTADERVRTLHFDVAFSPGMNQGSARGLELLPAKVHELLRLRSQELGLTSSRAPRSHGVGAAAADMTASGLDPPGVTTPEVTQTGATAVEQQVGSPLNLSAPVLAEPIEYEDILVDDDLVALENAARTKKRKIDATLGAGTDSRIREDGVVATGRVMTRAERSEELHRENPELSATVPFSPEATPPISSLFHMPPEQADIRIVQSTNSWVRAPRGDYKDAAVFVDGIAVKCSDPFLCGTFGPLGYQFMCVFCGHVGNFMSNSNGFPCCSRCFLSAEKNAQVIKPWRLQSHFTSPLEEASYYGMSSCLTGVDTPEGVVEQVRKVRKEFDISPLKKCAIMKNVHVVVIGNSFFCGRPVIEVTSGIEGDVALIAFDEWYSSFWQPVPGDTYWIAKIAIWGKSGNIPIHYMYHPRMGVGLAKQPGPRDAGNRRLLELFSGIGGWGVAWENVVGVKDIFSIDNDPNPCHLLALRRKSPVSSIDQLIEETGPTDVEILHGDVADPRWWITTIVKNPFEWLSWSSPCVSFSKAGWMTGLMSPEGVLLLRAVGLFVVFGCQLSLGENVSSLSTHGHWKLIESFAASLGNWVAVEINLARITAMQRPRLFMAQTRPGKTLDKKKIGEWISIALQDISITPQLHHEEDAVSGLSLEPTLIPLLKDPLLSFNPRVVSTEKRRTYGHGLAERVFDFPGEVLPVLMASYGRQRKLPRKLLEKKGLLTWLVADPRIGEGLRSIRYLQPAEALWSLGFGLFGPWLSDQTIVMKSIGNVVSPWIAGAFIAAVFASIESHEFIGQFRKWLQWYQSPRLALHELRTFLRGPYFWLGNSVPPLLRQGNDKWIVNWGYSFFLVQAHRHEITTDFVKEIAGLFHCSSLRSYDTASSGNTGRLIYVEGAQIAVSVPQRGTMMCEPGCTLGELHERLSLLPTVNSIHFEGCAPAIDTPLWAFVQDSLSIEAYAVGPSHVAAPGILRLILRDETFKVSAREGMTFWDAIRVTRCQVESSRIWDVVKAAEVHPLNKVPVEGGDFQVTLLPVNYEFAPYGIVSFPPMTLVGEVLTVLNGLWFGQKANLALTANGKTVEPSASIGLADKRGPLRIKVFGLKGGAKAPTPVELSDKLNALLIEKGVPKQIAEDRANQVYRSLGTRTLRQVFASQDPWGTLKQEASKERVILVGNIEKSLQKEEPGSSSSTCAPGEIQGAWQEWLDRRGKIRAAKAKEPAPVVETTSFQLDVNFFRSESGNGLPLASPEELLAGVAGIAVVQASDVTSLLPTFNTRHVTVGPSALVVIGGEAAKLGSKFQDLVVPGWLGTKTVALKVAVLSTGDEPLVWDKARTVNVDVSSGNTVCLCFIYQEEAGDKWQILTTGVDRFFRKIFPASADALVDHWASGFYAKKRKVDSQHAEYFHAVVRIADRHLESVLRVCGLNGLYLQPRSASRGIDTRFAIIRLNGFTRDEALAAQQQVSLQLGLVRTTKGLGLRVKTDKVKEAKKALFPDQEVSSDSGAEGELRFRLLGVPETCDRKAVKAIVKGLGWQAKVGKAVGWKTWLVSATVKPPARAVTVGEHNVVIAEEAIRISQDIVVAATEPKLKGLKSAQASVATLPAERHLGCDTGVPHTDKLKQVKDDLKAELEQTADARFTAIESAVAELKSTAVYQQNQTCGTKGACCCATADWKFA